MGGGGWCIQARVLPNEAKRGVHLDRDDEGVEICGISKREGERELVVVVGVLAIPARYNL